jgi:hypothetical protein
LGKDFAFSTPEFPSNVAMAVVGMETGGVEDEARGFGHFGADAIAG